MSLLFASETVNCSVKSDSSSKWVPSHLWSWVGSCLINFVWGRKWQEAGFLGLNNLLMSRRNSHCSLEPRSSYCSLEPHSRSRGVWAWWSWVEPTSILQMECCNQWLSCRCCCSVTSVVSGSATPSLDPPGRSTGVGCRFLLQCIKGKRETEVAQSCPTRRDPIDCSPPGSSGHGLFQARVLEWGAIAFSE